MMSEAEFIDRWRFHLAGIVLDAMETRNAAEREIFRRSIFAKIDGMLKRTYTAAVEEGKEAAKAEKALQNGQPARRS